MVYLAGCRQCLLTYWRLESRLAPPEVCNHCILCCLDEKHLTGHSRYNKWSRYFPEMNGYSYPYSYPTRDYEEARRF